MHLKSFLNRENGAILRPKLILFTFSLNLFIRFFWNYNWWQALKSWQKLFWTLKVKSYYPDNGGKWVKCWVPGSIVTSYLLLLSFFQLIIMFNVKMSSKHAKLWYSDMLERNHPKERWFIVFFSRNQIPTFDAVFLCLFILL